MSRPSKSKITQPQLHSWSSGKKGSLINMVRASRAFAPYILIVWLVLSWNTTTQAANQWPDSSIVDAGTGQVGQLTSQFVVNGHPAISYYDLDYGNLKYVRAQDAAGTVWGPALTLDSCWSGRPLQLAHCHQWLSGH